MADTETIEKPKDLTKDDVQKPKMYVVMVHNDPFTPRVFVVSVLQRYFQKNGQQAAQIMMTAHTQGHGAVGVYTFEIAEMKANVANTYSREQGHPLYFSVEEE
jgi:ATP-dependent Clp protease adaptor protein ClpS